MSRGIVMEIQRRNIVVLTPDGEFVRCRKEEETYEVGQEITFLVQQIVRKERSMFSSRMLKPIAVLAACLLVMFASFYGGTAPKTLAHVAIDINPSLEASVDEQMRVIKLEAYNEDGERILGELSGWENLPLADVVVLIVKQCEIDGYFTADKYVTLTSVIEDGSKKQQIEQLTSTIQTIQQGYEDEGIIVVSQESTKDVREAAKSIGITTGAYMKQQNMPGHIEQGTMQGEGEAEQETAPNEQKESEQKGEKASQSENESDESSVENKGNKQNEKATPSVEYRQNENKNAPEENKQGIKQEDKKESKQEDKKESKQEDKKESKREQKEHPRENKKDE